MASAQPALPRILAGVLLAIVTAAGAAAGDRHRVFAASAQMAAPAIHQTDVLDCEAAALQIALAARGISASQDAINSWIGSDSRSAVVNGGNVVQWGDPYQTFVGNVNGSEPQFTGYGVYYPPIVAAAQRAGAHAVGGEGWNPRDLYAAVSRGNPVVVWVIVGLSTPAIRHWTAWDGRSIPYAVGEHAETLIGFDDGAGTVTLANPSHGTIDTVPMGQFEASFSVFSNMAVVVGGTDVGIVPSPDGGGYLVGGSDGSVHAFGDAVSSGSLGGQHLNAPVTGISATPSGHGYRMAASDGGVFAFGDATFQGSMGGHPLSRPVVGLATTPSGAGYWLVGSDGGIFAFGDAGFFGSTGGRTLNAPVVGIAPTPDGRGYWLVASDGGIFAFGDAAFFGSMGSRTLNAPVVGISGSHTGGGYRLVASDGGAFAFGDASFFGSVGGQHLNAPVVAMVATRDDRGYWMLGSDGGIFAFGDAGFFGSEA